RRRTARRARSQESHVMLSGPRVPMREAAKAGEAPLLDIRGLKTHFTTDDGIVQAVDGVDLTVGRGETVCVVGESGCGKTVTAMSVLKLIAMPPGRIAGGQILDLLQDMKSRFGMSIMLITHAMGVVAEVAQRVVVMYAGKVVEEASVERLFANPRHPYTQGLIRSIPRLDMAATRKTRLQTIPGTVPKLIAPPVGCRFAARCNFATEECRIAQPALRELEVGHKVACIHAEAT